MGMVSIRAIGATLAVAVGLCLASCATPRGEATGAGKPSAEVSNGPRGASEARAAPTGASASPTAATASPTAATASPTTATASPTAGTTETVAASLKSLPEFGTVDLNRQPPAENTGQVCRVMLKPNTNSLINVCGTPAEWKRYDAAEAEATKELVIRMRSAPTLPPRPPGMR